MPEGPYSISLLININFATVVSDTILQPVLPKKKKTTTAPSVKDIKGSDNYMLTHQEEDSKGEVETKIFKVNA